MKLLIVFTSLVLAISASTDEELWKQFKQDHSKTYKSLREEKLRFEVFKSNLKTIEEHNVKYKKGEKSWFMGINQFSDLTDREFEAQYLKYNPKKIRQTAGQFVLPLNTTIAKTVDWREKGVVQSVKDQADCGSCWAFSAIAAIEGQNAIKHNRHVDLSPQELIDCSHGFPNHGCNGGLMDPAFEYVIDHGISTLSDYPYTAKDGTCQHPQHVPDIKVTGFTDITPNEQSLKEAVATIGPVSVAINAQYIHQYAGGIFDNPLCYSIVNHAVLAVGYGTENNHDYWLVKNSWGKTWGEKGYIKMTRNKLNQCGISSEASYPNIK